MPETIVVATDLSPRADRAVQRAFRLANWHDAKLLLLSVIDEALPAEIATQMGEAAELRLAQFAASVPYSGEVCHDTRVIVDDPAHGIPAVAAEAGADLLVLGLHRPRPFLDLLRETTMERIVRLCPVPVLLVHDPVDHTYSTVLAALDFSPASTAATDLAATLAPEADLFGVHALHIPYHGFIAPVGSAGAEAPFHREAEDRLSAWRKDSAIAARLKDVTIAEGAAHQVLAERIAALKPDLLALGAHGRAGAAPSILGSLANDMIREPPCDVLIARPQKV
ncbi:Universal stress protein UspA [Rhodovulum sp. P5]|uniref:universal stress protein n=1 Tax=Rhodovulum sp. P5 TaxID=1564506 RepID=UPI0009C21C6A|nr:universal stress protein [Rhodovulum sp. P5]ARE38812.1 Universal stress protein UspA [Rhodovulum sp. P5]